jgi:hypothetical protein
MCEFVTEGILEPRIIDLYWVDLSCGNIVKPFHLHFLPICHFWSGDVGETLGDMLIQCGHGNVEAVV